ncbi:hypothetical protein IJG14_01305, partial [bacterium]|nr:hypothetical protein [bacterium]
YFRALRGTFDIPEVVADEEFRKHAENISSEQLYEQLKKLDSHIAQKIHPNNKVKIIRAIEIFNAKVELCSKDCPYEILWIGLNSDDREFLYSKSEKRVDKMFENGLLEEAEMLFNKYGKNSILMNTIGIKELYNVIFNNENIDFAKNEIKKNTRHYIKRQISWFKNERDISWINIEKNKYYENEAYKMIEKFCKH